MQEDNIFNIAMLLSAMEIGLCMVSTLVICMELRMFFRCRRRLFSAFILLPKAVIKGMLHSQVCVEEMGEDTPAARNLEQASCDSGSSSSDGSEQGLITDHTRETDVSKQALSGTNLRSSCL